ncbi:unnamed protein product [Lampetra fluviatilis]
MPLLDEGLLPSSSSNLARDSVAVVYLTTILHHADGSVRNTCSQGRARRHPRADGVRTRNGGAANRVPTTAERRLSHGPVSCSRGAISQRVAPSKDSQKAKPRDVTSFLGTNGAPRTRCRLPMAREHTGEGEFAVSSAALDFQFLEKPESVRAFLRNILINVTFEQCWLLAG